MEGSGDVLANETDVGDGSLTVTAVDGSAGNVGSEITGSLGGKLTISSDGTYDYTPPPQGSVPNAGGTETFSYEIQDADGDADTTTIAFQVANNDLTPTAVGETVTTFTEGGSQGSGAVLANETDVGDGLPWIRVCRCRRRDAGSERGAAGR